MRKDHEMPTLLRTAATYFNMGANDGKVKRDCTYSFYGVKDAA